MPDIVALAPHIRCPTLFMRGDQESPIIYPAETFAARAGGPCEALVVPNCDHFYKGREETAIAEVSRFLASVLVDA
jgi:pimeloyl-ACP methyl ester carboxylesterase